MNIRLRATKIMTKLFRQEGSLSSLLPDALQQTMPRDRGLLQQLCYGTCRWQPKLDCYVQSMLDKPLRKKDVDVYALLLLGLYQLSELRIPPHAAISETVSVATTLKKTWAKGLINGVLRRFQREKDQLDQKLASKKAYQTAHPPWLQQAIENTWPNQAQQIFTANNSHPPLTLRVNQQLSSREDYQQCLHKQGMESQPTALGTHGIVLNEAVDVERLPNFAEGACSVQDEAAQLTAQLLQLSPNLNVLDACCAPGGKTAHILESELSVRCLGIDINSDRLERTQTNLDRLQLRAELKVADAADPAHWWDQQPFDRILLDAPCSATGVIRRHPDIKILREADNIAKLMATQQHLLNALWPLLAEDGLLLYATCSILPQENTEIVAEFVRTQENAEHQPIKAEWGIEQPYGRQILPENGGPDGFYYAVLKKHSLQKDKVLN